MRYYDINIGDGKLRYTSHPNGNGSPPDFGALQVEWDMFAVSESTAGVDSWIRIWGIPITVIAQANDLNFKPIVVKGGMGKGLPLATAQAGQAGILVQGSVKQAFANWIGTTMTLDLLITAPTEADAPAADKPRNIVLNWRKGQPLQSAVTNALSAALPSYQVMGSLDSNLKLNYDQPAFFGTTTQLAQHIREVSRDIKGGDYPGADIVVQPQNQIMLYDGTSKGSPKQIAFQDMIGQPTWIGPATVQVHLVCRGDIRVNDVIELPKTPINTQAGSQSQFSELAQAKQGSIFKGSLWVQKVHFIGNFRQPDGQAWATIIDGVYSTGQADAAAPDTAPVPAGGFASGPSGPGL